MVTSTLGSTEGGAACYWILLWLSKYQPTTKAEVFALVNKKHHILSLYAVLVWIKFGQQQTRPPADHEPLPFVSGQGLLEQILRSTDVSARCSCVIGKVSNLLDWLLLGKPPATLMVDQDNWVKNNRWICLDFRQSYFKCICIDYWIFFLKGEKL